MLVAKQSKEQFQITLKHNTPKRTDSNISKNNKNAFNKYNTCSAVAEMGDQLATIDMGRKEGGCYAPFMGGRKWVPI